MRIQRIGQEITEQLNLRRTFLSRLKTGVTIEMANIPVAYWSQILYIKSASARFHAPASGDLP